MCCKSSSCQALHKNHSLCISSAVKGANPCLRQVRAPNDPACGPAAALEESKLKRACMLSAITVMFSTTLSSSSRLASRSPCPAATTTKTDLTCKTQITCSLAWAIWTSSPRIGETDSVPGLLMGPYRVDTQVFLEETFLDRERYLPVRSTIPQSLRLEARW